MVKTIGNPLSWTMRAAMRGAEAVPGGLTHMAGREAVPQTRPIGIEDIRAAMRAGYEDFHAFRSDVIFACMLYPVIGLLLAWVAFDRALLPLLFPLVAGFALVGPISAIGLYEMSRRRADGEEANWSHGFALLQSPSLVPILAMGAILLGLFLAWLGAAGLIYKATLGPILPASLFDLIEASLSTRAGWAMIVIGFGVGFVFASVVLAVSLISLPLLVDRNVGLSRAVATSIAVARDNPRTVAAWGLLVAALLVVGSIPAFLGLIVVMPVLGHATWHLYRRAVVTR